jgi:hypothetical protein
VGAQPAGRGRPFLARRLSDPQLRARVEAAERLGVSVKRFDGWEPEQVTTYEYDDAGRLIRAVTVREPEWDEHEQGWALALAFYRDSLCPCGCGHPARDTLAPESAGHTWHVPPPVRCMARDALAQAQAQFSNPRPEAVLWRVEKR